MVRRSPACTCLNTCPSLQIFESITLEDIFNGVSKTVNLGARHMSFDVKPSFTSGSTLVFKDDGTGSGLCVLVAGYNN